MYRVCPEFPGFIGTARRCPHSISPPRLIPPFRREELVGQATVEQRRPGLNGWWQTSLYYADSGHRRPSSLKQLTQACGALSGRTFHSLASRGNNMERNKNKKQNKPTLETVPEAVSNLPLPAEVAPEATSHIPPPGNTTQEVVMPTSLPSPQQSALGTQEVPLHTEAPIHGKALSEEGSTSAEEVKSLQDIEDQLLNSPSTPMSTGTLDDATEQLGNLRMKRPNLTTAQRREALKAKLLEKGEAFDPSKWRRGKRRKRIQNGRRSQLRAQLRVPRRGRGRPNAPEAPWSPRPPLRDPQRRLGGKPKSPKPTIPRPLVAHPRLPTERLQR
ncbi:hypothetical protein J6590_056917 [Homalodisca vitripennis]|nr:hypothetical protein J6590_056917 [Homalodisca vitripennis]